MPKKKTSKEKRDDLQAEFEQFIEQDYLKQSLNHSSATEINTSLINAQQKELITTKIKQEEKKNQEKNYFKSNLIDNSNTFTSDNMQHLVMA